MKIKVGNKEYDARVAEDKRKGLSHVTNLPENEGMLFEYEEEGDRIFWMKDTPIPLDIIGINDDMEVSAVNTGKPNDKTHIKFSAKYVLEVNANSGVQVGDDVEFEDEETDEKPSSKMLVLDENGEVQMELDGGERIFSRKNTRVMIKLAKIARKSKKPADYKALGKKVFKFLDIQESNDPQYVELNKES